ncbi:uncharacterized protein LOC132790987 [Drosophila nasuta]|uniref:uncharacterized protein LOC132790987 n=1 Tax=Drosophila nasuta TaxID=42062 RepID=UPI00295E4F53|nr:uncharacterized protein LOC132790987 [Drosophila nasuta]
MSVVSEPETEAESLNVLCAICNEFYNANDIIYSTSSCGHIFHLGCLNRWLRRSTTCPQCRAVCHRQRIHRIYLNFAARSQNDDNDVERLPIQWVPIDLSDPSVAIELDGAIQSGSTPQGYDTYVARAYYQEDLLPGGYVPQARAVFASHGCHARQLNSIVDLLILTDCEYKWETSQNGQVPTNALVAGYSELGEVLYTGRGVHQGHTILGKVHPSHRVLYMPYNEQEVSARTYEVLVVIPKEQAER